MTALDQLDQYLAGDLQLDQGQLLGLMHEALEPHGGSATIGLSLNATRRMVELVVKIATETPSAST